MLITNFNQNKYANKQPLAFKATPILTEEVLIGLGSNFNRLKQTCHALADIRNNGSSDIKFTLMYSYNKINGVMKKYFTARIEQTDGFFHEFEIKEQTRKNIEKYPYKLAHLFQDLLGQATGDIANKLNVVLNTNRKEAMRAFEIGDHELYKEVLSEAHSTADIWIKHSAALHQQGSYISDLSFLNDVPEQYRQEVLIKTLKDQYVPKKTSHRKQLH